MEGFSDLAARNEVVALTGAGWGRSGDFTIDPLGLEGRFSREAHSTQSGGGKLAEGRLTFTLVGEEEFGGLSGECAHSRETFETSNHLARRTTLDTSTLTGPYFLTCGFYRGSEEIGGIEMHEERGGAIDVRLLRSGRAEVGEAEMHLTSVHEVSGTSLPTSSPIGYAMDLRDGGSAMLYSNGATPRIALPKAGRDERTAALLAGVALSLVWDPGDGD